MSDASEVVLAFPREIIDSYLDQGFSADVSREELAHVTAGKEIWEERQKLKAEKTGKQALPYEVYLVEDPDEFRPDLIVLYQRAKTVGEEKLLGGFSIGFGGHVNKEHDEVLNADATLNVDATIDKNIEREKSEEVIIALEDGRQIESVSEHLGFINDNSNDIGQSHFAYLSVRRLPFGTVVTSNEPNQVIQGAFTLHYLLNGGFAFENWSQIALDTLADSFNANGKYRPAAVTA